MKNVVIIGGGPAGCAAAIVLARGGAQVTLVESDATPRPATVESLPPQTGRLLRELGVWKSFLATAPVPSPGNLSLWGDDIPRATDFIFNPYGNGWHIERRRFDAMLLNEAQRAGAVIVSGRAVRVRREAGAWLVLVQSVQGVFAEFAAGFVVWAGGRNAPLPAAFSATRRKLDSLMAVAAFCLEDGTSKDSRTWTEAARDGWWYASPALDGRHLIAFFTDADIIPARDRVSWWREMLTATRLISRRVPRFDSPPALHTFCASTASTEPAAGGSWMAIGDAALAFDPLSSTGTTFALASGKFAAGELLGQQPPGEYAAWTARHLSHYKRGHHGNYSLEHRWPDAVFWSGRHAQENAAAAVMR